MLPMLLIYSYAFTSINVIIIIFIFKVFIILRCFSFNRSHPSSPPPSYWGRLLLLRRLGAQIKGSWLNSLVHMRVTRGFRGGGAHTPWCILEWYGVPGRELKLLGAYWSGEGFQEVTQQGPWWREVPASRTAVRLIASDIPRVCLGRGMWEWSGNICACIFIYICV